MEINSLKGVSLNSMFESFNDAFSDYEMQLNKVELQRMLQRRGFVPELSFAVFNNNKIISFTFNGIGLYKGIKTAYDSGTGTIKEFREKGLATKIFRHSIPFLKEAGVSQYLLEVLQHNSKAVSVYEKQGFKTSREFNYFIQVKSKIKFNFKIHNPAYEILQIDLSHVKSLIEFWDFYPSWQNSFESIFRKPDEFVAMGAFMNQQILGYCILEPESGDITQIGVDKQFRRNGVGTLLLSEILKLNNHHSVKLINNETSCDCIPGFLQSFSIPMRGKQFEMIKQL
ncbi:MAG TPA: GNAT family N-acetyltransferase [Draconibacterium sp.]|nr:GNAT family N-acetyltransferase [Draconibacterium sp.]